MRERILVPVDLTDSTAEVLIFAGEMARSRDGALVVLHVVNGFVPPAGKRNGGNGQHLSRSLVDRAREQLESLLQELGEQHPGLLPLRDARTVVVTGVASSRILEVAQHEGVGMIVMGSHGRRGVPRLMVGSVAESVARASPVPVSIVKEARAAAFIDDAPRTGSHEAEGLPC